MKIKNDMINFNNLFFDFRILMSWLKEWHQQQWQQQPHQKLHQKTLVQGIYYRLLQNLFNIGFNNTTVFFLT